jgi:ATP-dependent Clp protease ATP-binding subunit ClpA
MFDFMNEAARHVMASADQESDRLSHNYLGNEHVLIAVAQSDSAAARALSARGLDAAALRVEVNHLVRRGVLPPAWRRDADLLRRIGIDLAAVRQSMDDAFGVDAVNDAVERATRRTGWTPLCGKTLVLKQSLQLAGALARDRGQAPVGPEYLLLGVLADARNPINKPRCFSNPWARSRRARLGLPQRGPSPVRLVVEARGWPLKRLHAEILDELIPISLGPDLR